ncbi:MAG TPA: LUD domain-containing protein [Cytophagales bacterium]|nr:LUD domain-containing protein [Cytophagales bacterium]
MGIVSSKDVILGKIRTALSKKFQKPIIRPDFNQSLYQTQEEDLAVLFAENLVSAKAEFVYCERVEDFQTEFFQLVKERGYKNIAAFEKEITTILPQIHSEYITNIKGLKKADVGVTHCESFIARLGSILFSSKQAAGRGLSIYPPINVVVGYTSQLVFDIKDGLKKVQEKYPNGFPSMVSLTTGPSRTADIEKTLVMGAHGPKELIVFLIDDSAIGL